MYYMERIKIDKLNTPAALAGWRRCAYATSDRYGILVSPDVHYWGKFYIAAYQERGMMGNVLFELNYADVNVGSGSPSGDIINIKHDVLRPLVEQTEYRHVFSQIGDRIFFKCDKRTDVGQRVSSDFICKSNFAGFLDTYGTRLFLALKFRDRVSSMEDAAELLAHLKNVERFVDETRAIYSSIGRLIEEAQTRISKARQEIASNDELRRQAFSKYNSALEVLARHGIKDRHKTS